MEGLKSKIPANQTYCSDFPDRFFWDIRYHNTRFFFLFFRHIFRHILIHCNFVLHYDGWEYDTRENIPFHNITQHRPSCRHQCKLRCCPTSFQKQWSWSFQNSFNCFTVIFHSRKLFYLMALAEISYPLFNFFFHTWKKKTLGKAIKHLQSELKSILYYF